MKVSKKEKEVINKALQYWKDEGLIDKNLSKDLSKSIITKGFDWKKLAFYTSVFALISLVIAIVSIFADTALMKLINSFLNSSYLTKAIISTLITAVFYYLDLKYAGRTTKGNVYTREIFALLAAISAAITTGLFSFVIGFEENPGFLIMILSLGYLLSGALLQKNLYWIFGMFAFLIGFSALSVQLESSSGLFFGLNFPARFLILGFILLGLSLLSRNYLDRFYLLNYKFSLLLIFFSFWILSITGNFHSYQDWLEVRQYEFWLYSILLLASSSYAIVLGIKKEDDFLRLTGVVFLILGLYTRYFEYFWDSMHKAVFFLILALSFWLVAKWAERIWNKTN